MSLWLRAGPFSVSSRGRMGVRVGPVGVYGGGRRRSSSGSGAALFGLLIILAVVFVAVMWPLSLFGHAIGLTPSWHQLMNRHHTWMHHHYPLVGLRYLGAAVALLVIAVIVVIALTTYGQKVAEDRGRSPAAEAPEQVRVAQTVLHRAGSAPPPPLEFPTRFTATWIAKHVPRLQPDQVPVLIHELQRRGWTTTDIAFRVEPYLPDHLRTSNVRPSRIS